jgi:hypothetical protein
MAPSWAETFAAYRRQAHLQKLGEQMFLLDDNDLPAAVRSAVR